MQLKRTSKKVFPMFNIDLTRYENSIKFSPDFRNEYDSYLMTVLNTDTKQVLKSACFSISFDGEELALNSLKDMMNEHYPDLISDFGYSLDSVEHSASVLLCRLEMEDSEGTYHDSIEMPMTAFRGRSLQTGRLLFKMPENVIVLFKKIDGSKEFEKDKELFEKEESRLSDLYIDDITSATELSKEKFLFLTKHIRTNDRFEYIMKTSEHIKSYFELC